MSASHWGDGLKNSKIPALVRITGELGNSSRLGCFRRLGRVCCMESAISRSNWPESQLQSPILFPLQNDHWFGDAGQYEPVPWLVGGGNPSQVTKNLPDYFLTASIVTLSNRAVPVAPQRPIRTIPSLADRGMRMTLDWVNQSLVPL